VVSFVDKAREFGLVDANLHQAEDDVRFERYALRPLIAFSEDRKELVTAEPGLAELAMMVTNGDPEQMKRLCAAPGGLRRNILKDSSHWIRFIMLSRLLHLTVSDEPSIALSAMKTITTLIGQVNRDAKRKSDSSRHGSTAAISRGEGQARKVAGQLLDVEEAGGEGAGAPPPPAGPAGK
jgi:hypothetical protein